MVDTKQTKPLAEPARNRVNADLGGGLAGAGAGLGDALDGPSERRPGEPSRRVAAAALDGAVAKDPESDVAASQRTGRDDDEEEPWRHPPVVPKDASIADSIGRSVSDVVTGSDDGQGQKKVKP